MADLGYDLAGITDLTPEMSEVGGRLCFVQALARRIITPRGGLIDVVKPPTPEVANYGYDLTDFLDADLVSGEESQIAGNVDVEFLKDERTKTSRTTIQQVKVGPGANKIIVTSIVSDGDGPFKFVLSVSQEEALVLSLVSL